MRSGHILKIILLALPAIVLLYVFLIRDRIDAVPGIGGGGYDLTKVYMGMAAGAYLLILNLVLLIQDANGNRILLLAGVALLIISIILTVRSF